MSDMKDNYELIKQVGKDAWDVGTGIAPYIFNEKNIDGSPTDRMGRHFETEPADHDFKPTSGNKTFDKVLEWFL